MQTRHYLSLDILRGFVAILVCFYHLTEGFLPEDNILRTVFSRGYLGVEIFFVISGFVIPYTMYQRSHRYADTGRFLLRRLIRIEPPYWMSIVLVFLVDYILTFSRHYKDKLLVFDLQNILLHIFHLNDVVGEPWLRGIYWSLAIEVQFYVLMAIIFPLLASKSDWLRYLCLILFCMGRWINIEHSVLYYGCHFVCGVLFFQYAQGIISKREFVISMLCCWGITFWCFDIYHLSAVVGSALIIYFFNVHIGPLVFMGKISYSFYLIHIPVAWVLTDFLGKSYPGGNPYVHISIGVAMAILAAYIFYLIIEKPCHILAKKI